MHSARSMYNMDCLLNTRNGLNNEMRKVVQGIWLSPVVRPCGRMFASHISVLGFAAQLWLLVPDSCSCRPWEGSRESSNALDSCYLRGKGSSFLLQASNEPADRSSCSTERKILLHNSIESVECIQQKNSRTNKHIASYKIL